MDVFLGCWEFLSLFVDDVFETVDLLIEDFSEDDLDCSLFCALFVLSLASFYAFTILIAFYSFFATRFVLFITSDDDVLVVEFLISLLCCVEFDVVLFVTFACEFLIVVEF